MPAPMDRSSQRLLSNSNGSVTPTKPRHNRIKKSRKTTMGKSASKWLSMARHFCFEVMELILLIIAAAEIIYAAFLHFHGS